MKSVNELNSDENSALFYNASSTVNHYVLAAGVAENITVPSGARLVSFSPTVPFYANFNGGTAAVPVADVTDGSGSSYCPQTRYLNGITTISVISSQAGVLTAEFYTL